VRAIQTVLHFDVIEYVAIVDGSSNSSLMLDYPSLLWTVAATVRVSRAP
jgi:hypothetical protein